jgi:phage shock protein A
MSDVSRSLHIQGEAAKCLLANIRDVIGDDEDMAATAVEGETTLVEAISGAVDRHQELEAFQEVLETQIKALSERRSRFEDQAARIKAAIHVAMGQGELRKLELPQH